MTQLDNELKNLVDGLMSMTKLTVKQIKRAKKAYLEMDLDTAEEVIGVEKRLNSMELSIDRECENILALYSPVATDLRLVIASLKIISDLERIGDYACGIANYVVHHPVHAPAALIKSSNVEKMFDLVISMLEDIRIAIEEEDTDLARKVYSKDSKLNKINENAMLTIKESIAANPDGMEEALYLFSIIRKLERSGDHIKNIAEDLIFYIDVVVLRHKEPGKPKQ